jgi:hypothetical protein
MREPGHSLALDINTRYGQGSKELRSLAEVHRISREGTNEKRTKILICEISSSHGGEYEAQNLLG